MPDTASTNPDLTIFVPCLNEGLRIEETLTTLRNAMSKVELTYEILVTDDGSTDDTSEAVRRFQTQNEAVHVCLHRNEVNLGLAHSFIDAAVRGTGEYFFQCTGDGGWSEESLIRVLSNVEKCDLVTSYFPELEGKSATRQAISRLYTALVNLASGNSLRYYNGGLLCKRRHVVRWAPRDASFFEFNAFLITHLLAHGARIIEVPVEGCWHVPKDNVTNVFKIKNFLSVGRVILAIWQRRLRFALFAKPVDLQVLDAGLLPTSTEQEESVPVIASPLQQAA